MKQARIGKSLARRTLVSWREDPSQHDLEALRSNVERVGLVIRARWAIVGAIVAFSLATGLVFSASMSVHALVGQLRVPAVALLFVIAYNTYYQLTYRRFGNIAYLNQAQLLMDISVATVLVYYSGGVLSWFSSMYLLFILEGAFILPKRQHVWLLTGAATALLAVVFFGGYLGWLPPVSLPIVDSALSRDITYVTARYLWEVTMFAGAALAGGLMMSAISEHEVQLSKRSVYDRLTGLLNERHFRRVLPAECIRAKASGSQLALLLVDVDRLADINHVFGFSVGDRLLAGIAELVQTAAEGGGDESPLVPGVAYRFGGEEFAAILPGGNPVADGRTPLKERAGRVADEIVAAAALLRVDDVGVTVSVGLAIFPDDGPGAGELLDAADRALAEAMAFGGNAVRYAEQGADDSGASGRGSLGLDDGS